MPLNKIVLILSIILILLGFRLASQKPLWNDEIYSQTASVEHLSYAQILTGKVGEGNVSPVFYLIQKAICQYTGYLSPSQWQQGSQSWGTFDRLTDRIVLRIGPVLMMAFAIAGIFYYFAKYYSWGTALFSLFLSLSSGMIWNYWAEARPYALWMALTTAQTLLFLAIIRVKAYPEYAHRLLSVLAGIHILLAFSVILSLPQIGLVSLLLWLYGWRDSRRYFILLLVPVLVALTYYWISPKYPFGLIFSVEQYLRANISRDRLYLFMMFGLFLTVFLLQKKYSFRWISDVIKEGLPAFVVGLGMILCACGILLLFKMKQGSYVQFPVTEKYFIFLTPVGVIASTMFVDTCLRSLKYRWARVGMALGVAALVIPRALKVFHELYNQYPGLF